MQRGPEPQWVPARVLASSGNSFTAWNLRSLGGAVQGRQKLYGGCKITRRWQFLTLQWNRGHHFPLPCPAQTLCGTKKKVPLRYPRDRFSKMPPGSFEIRPNELPQPMWKTMWKLWKVLWKRVEVRRANRLCCEVCVPGGRQRGESGGQMGKRARKEETESSLRYPVCKRKG